MIKKVVSETELEGFVSGGTLVTGKFALRQGKPVFVMVPEGSVEDDVEEIVKEIGCDSLKEKDEGDKYV